MKPVFAKMSSINFYPEDVPAGCVEITCIAPGDTEAFAGHVVILPIYRYKELMAAEAKLKE